METIILTALIGGFFGVICAYIGALMARQTSRLQSERTDAQNAAHLASIVAPDLRSFAEACLNVADDDGWIEGRRAGERGEAEPTVEAPTFTPPGSDVVEWKSLPPDLMQSVMTFPERVRQETGTLNDFDAYWDPPDHPQFFADRQYIYVKLGLKALALARSIHEHAKLPESDVGESLRQKLTEPLSKLEADRALREERIRMARERQNAELAAMQSEPQP